ncbi:MAG: hypothetical protein HC860_23425 [Alkalinema sp. RU_4_3]|nr:hypothetical protein [Alkalinema sp. RU_4_3]
MKLKDLPTDDRLQLIDSFIHLIDHPAEFESIYNLDEVLRRTELSGWEMGLRAKPFMAQKWEAHWEKPVSQWREELQVDHPWMGTNALRSCFSLMTQTPIAA